LVLSACWENFYIESIQLILPWKYISRKEDIVHRKKNIMKDSSKVKSTVHKREAGRQWK